MKKITESPSPHQNLEQKSISELLQLINQEDQKVALAVSESLPQIEPLIEIIVQKMKKGGRLFYLGAGTSGRLGILDASECPPTFGVPENWVIGLIAGGDSAIRKAIEFAEDNTDLAWQDLQKYLVNQNDVVIGISASGTTPYVVEGLKICQENGITTGCITSNLEMPISQYSDFPIEVITGAEFVTGSTRLKAGTAQKLILNMISTTVMIQLGRVLDNKMVDMQLSNQKLVERGARMLMEVLGLDFADARQLLLKYGSVRKALENFNDSYFSSPQYPS